MMIPSVIADGTSGGEEEVFRRLRDDPGTRDWIVLHSLGLANHVERVAGEIDFVVIIPRKGILCLEVKGCSASQLKRDEDGRWFYGRNDRGDPRGPFRQAAEGMHSLRNYLCTLQLDLSRIQFSSGVIFPFAPFNIRSVEWNDWEVIDSRLFRSTPLSRSLTNLMATARSHLLSAALPPRLDSNVPTGDQCTVIRNALRSRFEIPPDRRARTEHLERQLQRYTTEQFVALDAMESHPRMIFAGPAGVGKTLLAIEAARRARAAGRRVLLICFNQMLGSWLERQTSELYPEVVARTLHRHMLIVSELRRAPENATPVFWQTTLPEKACDRLLEEWDERHGERVFDELVIDEAQDIMRESYLDFLDLSLRGGFSAGRWRLFGDFEHQVIYAAANMDLQEFRERRAADAPVYSLRVNCRNTPLIAEWTRVLAELNPGYHRILRPDDGVSPIFRFYEDDVERVHRLVDALTTLEEQGFRGQDVVVLSPRTDHDCAAACVQTPPWRDRLWPIGRAGRGHVGYGTIQAFKGLEAPAVIVTDIETIATPRDRALLYISTTRPLQRLIILAHARVRDEAVQIIRSPNLLGQETQ